jgi:hypothetical protein
MLSPSAGEVGCSGYRFARPRREARSTAGPIRASVRGSCARVRNRRLYPGPGARVAQHQRRAEPFSTAARFLQRRDAQARVPIGVAEEESMHSIIYLVGLIVVILFILSFLGLR